MKRTFVLVILDGWGLGTQDESNPIYAAAPKTIRFIESNFPSGALQASGISVGLPWEDTGNSEVGHLTLGAGKILYQHYPRISLAIQDETFFTNEIFKNACRHAKENHSALHITGLLTKGTVHAAFTHLIALLELTKREKCSPVYLHLFTDGRDSGSQEAGLLLQKLEAELKRYPHATLASLMGRHYAMSRDGNWERTKKAYEFLTGKTTPVVKDWKEMLQKTYDRELNDEFVEPAFINTPHPIQNNDAILFFNFREDSMRQLVEPFVNSRFETFPMKPLSNIFPVTMTNYDESFGVSVAFPKETIENPLGKVLADKGKNQLRIAETEKYAHVTYFFNGLKEEAFPNEFRVLIPSQKLVRHEEHPEMQASAITDRALAALHGREFDFILLNYANPDIVAHTGNYEATVKAIKTVDQELERLVRVIIDEGHVLMITADHGNAETIINPRSGKTETQHNPNPVPYYLIARDFKLPSPRNWPYRLETIGILSDVAPTLLALMNIPKPEDMTGQNLLDELLY